MAFKKKKQKSVRAQTAELNIVVAKKPKPLLIGKINPDNSIESNRIVTHDGKIPEHLKDDGWMLYRCEFEKEHNSEFHEIEEKDFIESEYTIDKRKTAIVKTLKNKLKLSLADYKNQKKDIVDSQAFIERENILPQYKIDNAVLGVYHDSEKRLEIYNNTIQKFIEVSNSTQSSIDSASDHATVFNKAKNVEFPKELVTPDNE